MNVDTPPVLRKVMFLLGSLQGGGVQIATFRLADEFRMSGYAVEIVAVDGRGPLRGHVPPGCSFVDLRAGRVGMALPALLHHLRTQRPAGVISAQTHVNALMIVARRLAGIPRTLIVCEHIALDGAVKNSTGLFEKLRPLLIRTLYPLADHVVAVSDDSARSLREAAGLRREVRLIHNGLDVDQIARQAREPCDHPWLDRQGFELIVAVGRLAPQKNFGLLLQAVALLPPGRWRLVVLGDGPDRSMLLSLARRLGIQAWVDFPGFVENPFPFLAACDVFALSSRWEGFANVVLEALACGAPIVATDCPGGPAGILAEARLGRVVPMDDPHAMAQALRRTLDTPTDRPAVSEYARRFSVHNTLRQYRALLESPAARESR